MTATPLRSRREILKGRVLEAPPSEHHVSSLVVHVRPDYAASFRQALGAIPGAELHAEQGGKAVVTLETASDADLVTRMNEISLLDGVLSTALVFHHAETAPSPARPDQEQP